jgi:hypothetical protein
VASLAATAAIPTTTSALAIGNKPGSTHPADPFSGVLDDVSIHAVALSAAQIAQLWTVGSTGPGPGGGGGANQAPVPTMDTPTAGTTWAVGSTLAFSGGATDAEDGTLGASALTWTLTMEHCPSNCHTHVVQTWTGVASGSVVAPDHEYPSSLVLSLAARDSAGTTTTISRRLDPQTAVLSFTSSPSGLQLSVGGVAGTTPFSRTVIRGSAVTLAAPTSQSIGGETITFVSWSDGGAAAHSVTASASASYVATYTQPSGGGGGGGGQTYAQLLGSMAPVAYWRLGETGGTSAADSAGTHTGTYAGGVTFGVTGLLTGDANTAVRLNGSTGQVTVPNSAALNPTNALTIAGWVNATAWSNRRIVQKGLTDNQYRLTAESGVLKFHLQNVGTVQAPLPSLNVRHFVVGTYDRTTLRLYVDGVQVASLAATAAIPTTTSALAIGNKPGSTHPADPFNGVLDDVSIHAVALSAAQIAQLWTVGSTGPG